MRGRHKPPVGMDTIAVNTARSLTATVPPWPERRDQRPDKLPQLIRHQPQCKVRRHDLALSPRTPATHKLLVEAIGSRLPGSGWRLCWPHYPRTLLTRGN
jgi:hypothetical protein